MGWQISAPERAIIYVEWDGSLDATALTLATLERVALADQHGPGDYVLILDVRKARIAEINVRVARWMVETDPRMFFTLVVGRNIIAHTVANMLAKFGVGHFEFTDAPERAIDIARRKLAERAAKLVS
jgi:hypothetical protein